MNLSEQTLELVRQLKADLAKNTTYQQSTGLTQYDLEQTAYNIYPVLAPLRNQTSRVKSSRGDTATRWKAVTAINTTNEAPGVNEGRRTSSIGVTVANFTAAYATLGHEASTTFEAEEAAESFADARANAAMAALQQLIMSEDKTLLGGNGDYPLGSPVLQTPTASGTGSSLGTATYSLYVVALTLAGYSRASIANGCATTISRSNNDGTTDTLNGGTSKLSNNKTVAVTAGNNVVAVVNSVPGAVAYAWYWGAAGSELLGAITTINSVTISAAAVGTQNASAIGATDYSADAYVFDGFLTLAAKAGTGYNISLNGAAFTSDSASGINEIDVMLQSMYDNYRLGPTKLWMSSTEARNINKKVIANGGAPLVRFAMDNSGGAAFTRLIAGSAIGSYFNKFTQEIIPIEVEPYMPQGTVLALTSRLPYAVPDVPAEVYRIKARREYYGMDWPVTTRTYFHGAYVTEVLQHYAPFSVGVIQNVLNG
jgi:hypothetical protein